MDGIGTGSRAPSLTNTGNTSCRAATVVSVTSRRIAAVVRSRRGLFVGYMGPPAPMNGDARYDTHRHSRGGASTAPCLGFAGWGKGAGGAQLGGVGG